MWYPPSLVAWASLILLAPSEPTIARGTPPGAVARATRIAACDAGTPSLPGSIQLADGLERIVRSTLEYSPTFRQQCRRLAAASAIRAIVRVSYHPTGNSTRALTTFRQNRSGLIAADIELRSARDLTELIAHEFEHLLERIEGIDLQKLSHGGEARRRTDGAFETARAIQVGQRVAGEVLNNSPDRLQSAGSFLWRGLRRAVNGQRQPATAQGSR
jgi:hypothetical protein